MKKIYLKSALALAVTAASCQALANGIALNEQSASSAGTAYAGRASTARDASILYGNPAGLSRLERTQISAGGAFIHAKTDISNAQAQGAVPFTGTNDGDMVPDSGVPFAYFATPLEGNWHFGVGLYAPFGVAGDYEDSFLGRYEGLKSEVQVVTLQPTLSYAFNDRVSVGIGPTFNRIEGTLTAGVNPAFPDGKADIEGHDSAVGYNVGLLVALTDQLDWGVTYHSKVEYTLNGNTDLTGVPLPGLNGHYSAKLDITMPESVDTSFTYRLDDQWTLFAGATWTRWSRLKEFAVENSGVNAAYQPLFGTVREELNWEDTLSVAVGTAYQLNPEWQLRAGFALDPSPTSNEDRTVRIPVSNRKIATLGAGWAPTRNLSVDVAYAYLWESKGSVNQDTYSADFENSAHGVSGQVTYRF
ncbi:OmpP1/FadL family transporter [Alloalcanivorax mobilis]|uniref:OmpP1/FadL family transporter n=1 Tax=Alloalcanivorax mobilis TaxID=2019569 RepID=UPI000B5B1159|nr:outer membrane protein transport protein [Alloalcanivorax mobilis]ASK34322.1 Long-chain fatty acid transport protein [Alcanivorax sp. N3-2A]